MPKAVPVTFKDFFAIETKLKSLGFVEMSRREVWDDVKAHGLENPKGPRKGEVGFKFFQKGLVVKVWTSCLREEVERCRRIPLLSQDIEVSRPPQEDLGHVLITDPHNHAEYFARTTRRTKHFVKNLLQKAIITAQRVQNRPLCGECQCFMNIHREPSGATYWECQQFTRHKEHRKLTKDWDCGLGPKGKKLAKGARKAYRRTRDKEKKEGRGKKRAAEIRIGWNATKNPYPAAS